MILHYPFFLPLQITPPFVPKINADADDDTAYFDPMFTDETPNFTPVNEGAWTKFKFLINCRLDKQLYLIDLII